MRNNKQPQEDPIRLDDLFQLKRQEKPDQQFWEEFDVQLQQKMLGSMVDRRNLLDRFRQFMLRRILPLSLAGSALAALVVSLSPLWKPVHSDKPNTDVEVAALSQPSNTEIESVDFHEATLSATQVDFDSLPEFSSLELSVDASLNAVYETNGLVASSDSLLTGIAEQLF